MVFLSLTFSKNMGFLGMCLPLNYNLVKKECKKTESTELSVRRKMKDQSNSAFQYATCDSPFICCMLGFSRQLCLKPARAVKHYLTVVWHPFSTFRLYAVSDQSFLSEELFLSYHNRLSKWLCHLIWAMCSLSGQTGFKLTGMFVSHCSLNTVCPVSLLLFVVHWLGPKS